MSDDVVRQEDVAEDFGRDHGVIHEAVVTGRKVGAGRAFWSRLAHSEELFGRVVEFVRTDGAVTVPATPREEVAKPAPSPVVELTLKDWAKVYREDFGLTVNVDSLRMPENPFGEPVWPIVEVPEVSNNRVYAVMKRRFMCSSYTDKLNSGTDLVPCTEPRIILVRARIEADEELKNLSAIQLAMQKVNCLGLQPRMLLELAFYKKIRKHLDRENYTLCAGSCDPDGNVPRVGWNPRYDRVRVDYWRPDCRPGYLRARQAVL